MSISIVIVDDHQIVLEGVSGLIKNRNEFTLLGTASNGAEALELLKSKVPDIILMDLMMPEMDGIEATQKIKAKYPEIGIIGLSMADDLKLIQRMIENGAQGFLLKNCSQEDLATAIHRVNRGEHFYDPGIAQLMVFLNSRVKKTFNAFPKLSLREKDILKLILDEYTTKEIAEELGIKFGTVESHRRNMMDKLGARNMAGLVKTAIEHKLLD